MKCSLPGTAHASRLHFWCRLRACLRAFARLASLGLSARSRLSACLVACLPASGSRSAFARWPLGSPCSASLGSWKEAEKRPSLQDIAYLEGLFLSSLGGFSLGGFPLAFPACLSRPLFSPLSASNSPVTPYYLQGLERPFKASFRLARSHYQEARPSPPFNPYKDREARPSGLPIKIGTAFRLGSWWLSASPLASARLALASVAFRPPRWLGSPPIKIGGSLSPRLPRFNRLQWTSLASLSLFKDLRPSRPFGLGAIKASRNYRLPARLGGFQITCFRPSFRPSRLALWPRPSWWLFPRPSVLPRLACGPPRLASRPSPSPRLRPRP